MNKKAVVEVQFHWIFVLIAGAFILVLFVILINSGRAVSNDKFSAATLVTFDKLFSDIKTQENLNQPILSRNSFEIKISCDYSENGLFSTIQMGDNVITRNSKTLAIFSHEIVSGSSLYAKTMGFYVPFRIDNVLYLTDSNILYAIVDTDLSRRAVIRDLLPLNISLTEKNSARDITESGFREYVIITPYSSDDIYSQLPSHIAKSKTLILMVQPTAGGTSGKVHFFGYEKSTRKITGDVSYSEKTQLLGALMSASPSFYECTMQKLYEKTSAASTILAKKADILFNDPIVRSIAYDDTCVPRYADAREQFEFIADHPSQYKQSVEYLQQINNGLELLSCPLIY